VRHRPATCRCRHRHPCAASSRRGGVRARRRSRFDDLPAVVAHPQSCSRIRGGENRDDRSDIVASFVPPSALQPAAQPPNHESVGSFFSGSAECRVGRSAVPRIPAKMSAQIVRSTSSQLGTRWEIRQEAPTHAQPTRQERPEADEIKRRGRQHGDDRSGGQLPARGIRPVLRDHRRRIARITQCLSRLAANLCPATIARGV